MNSTDLVMLWAQWMLHAGWQAAVVAIAAIVLLWSMRRRLSSQMQYAVLCLALLKFAAPPFLIASGTVLDTAGVFSSNRWLAVPSFKHDVWQEGPVNTKSSTASPNQDSIEPAHGGEIAVTSPASQSARPSNRRAAHLEESATGGLMSGWLLFLAIVYAGGFVSSVVAAAWQFRRVRQVLQQGRCGGSEILARASVLCTRLKMKLPRVLVSETVDSPFATGVLRPVVVLPRTMLEDLEPDQLDIVLAHELVHIRRRDLLIGWLEVLLTAVWWFHPVIWWLRSSLRRTREECCDDALVACQLAQPVRYCETLIQVAKHQSSRPQISSFAEPVVLGFASGEHPAANRIRRLMDGGLLRREHLRVSAVAVTLLLALILLPGTTPEERPVTKTTLEGWLGWKNLPFKISAEEEARVKELLEIARSYFHQSNNVRKFDEPGTRERIEEILKEDPGCFYAQHLLGTWHLRNGSAEEGRRLIEESLAKAPVVLKQRFRFGNNKPLQNVEFQQMTIECNRVRNGSLNPDLKLMYPVLVTDELGQVRVPVYKTVYRFYSYSFPEGYRLEETETLGWFKSTAHTGVLPDMLAWVPYSRPQDFSRAAAETKLLKDASGTLSQKITSGKNTYVLESVARANRDSTFAIESGRGIPIASSAQILPELKNSEWMDHAVIDLKVPAADQFAIERTVVLDSRTKLPLPGFQSGAGVRVFDDQRFHVYSLWKTLPESIDLVLQVNNYDEGFRVIVPAKEGAMVQHNGATLTIPHLIAGQHQGWSSVSGYVGEPHDVNTTCEVELSFTGQRDQRFSVWVVLKTGDQWNIKPGGWFSANLGGGGGERLNVPLGDIDHFELRPYAVPTTIFFEDIRLPARHGELNENVPVIEFPVHQHEQDVTSDVFSPLNINFRSRRGRVYAGISSSEYGMSLQEQHEGQQSADTHCTFVWWTNGSLECHKTEEFIVRPESNIDPARVGGSRTSADSNRTSVTVVSRNIPLEAVQAVQLKLSPK